MAETKSVSPLVAVPNEILYHIAGYLLRCDVSSLQRTCVAFHLPLRSLLISQHKNDILIFAARENHLELLTAALVAGADLTYTGRTIWNSSHNGRTALHHAACGGHTAILTELLRYNPPLESVGETYETALHCAASNGHQAAVDLLLLAGSDPNTRGGQQTSFLFAAIVGNLIPTATAFISQMGQRELLEAIMCERLEIVTLMFARGITATIPPPLLVAASAGVSFVKLCLEHGAPIHQLDPVLKFSPLAAAISGGQIEAVKYLLAQGADPNFGPRKRRPIMSAVDYRYTDVVRLLLAHGADLRALTNPLADVLARACERCPPELVALLLDADQGLLVDGHSKDDRKQRPLHVAAQSGNTDVVRLLLERGAEVNAVGGPKWETPLHWAARAAKRSAVEALLEGGADTKLLCNGATALLMANRSCASLEDRGRTMAALVKGGARIGELGKKSRLMVNKILAEEKLQEKGMKQASKTKKIAVR